MKKITLITLLAILSCATVVGAAPKKAKPAPKRAIELDVPRDQVIAGALYTVHDNILKLNAQLFPLKEG